MAATIAVHVQQWLLKVRLGGFLVVNTEESIEPYVGDDEQLLGSLVDSYLNHFQSGSVIDPYQLLGPRSDLAERLERRLAVVRMLCAMGPQVLPGSRVDQPDRIGRYDVIGVLGAGAMGYVYKARHPMMDRVVAIKVIAPRLTSKRHAVERFEREVRAAARLHHPNIVAAYDADHAGLIHFLVMEFVAGVDLAKLLAANGPLCSTLALECLRQAALGLQHAHEQGMVHRDLKPSNLMITPQGVVKILDFGLARITESSPFVEIAGENRAAALRDGARSAAENRACDFTASDLERWSSTCTHTLLGTPDYVSPEQARDPRIADERSDIYSLGATFYHLLTGRVPFPGHCNVEKIDRRQVSPPQPIGELVPEIDWQLAHIVTRMLAHNPHERFRNAGEIIDALNRDGSPECDVCGDKARHARRHNGILERLRTGITGTVPLN